MLVLQNEIYDEKNDLLTQYYKPSSRGFHLLGYIRSCGHPFGHVHMVEDADCGMKAVNGEYSLEEYVKMLPNVPDSVSFVFQEPVEISYNLIEKELFVHTHGRSFDLNAFLGCAE